MALRLPIFLDNHSTTKPDDRVIQAMLPYFSDLFGNAASRQHEFGWEAEAGVENARRQVAALVGALSEEVIFTSGATESVNLGLRGVAEANIARGRHMITASTEHPAVLETLNHLREYGFRITVLPVDGSGLVDPQAVRASITGDTLLVSIMAANNEIGTIAPVAEIGRICRESNVLFHTDATQAAGTVPLRMSEMGIDLLSLSAHKIHGPKGAGALVIGKRQPPVRVAAQITGGGHEGGRRAGTLNVPAIVGFGRAAEIARADRERDVVHMQKLRDLLVDLLQKNCDDVTVNGHPSRRLVNNASVTFAGARADAVIMAVREVAVSTGAACSSAAPGPSHVLEAIGLSRGQAASTIRFGLSKYTTEEEIRYAAQRFGEAVLKSRKSVAVATT